MSVRLGRAAVFTGATLLGAAGAAGMDARTGGLVRPPTEASRVGQLVLASDAVRALDGGEVHVVSVAAGEESKTDAVFHRMLEVLVVTYRDGRGYRAAVDPEGKRVTALTPLPGRPQSSADERARAALLVAATPELSSLLRGGAVLHGGFVVDPPAGAPAGRYLEYHLVSAERREMLREVVVDLTRARIAAVGTRDGGASR